MIAETRPVSNVEQAVPFLWVRDMDRGLRFYVEGLGFVMTKHWLDDGKIRWCWLTLGNAAVMLQEFWSEGPHRNLPDGKLGAGVTTCFICKDAVALWRELVSRGVTAKRPFVGHGMWVTEVSDPDGYQLLFESPTDEPEETILPEGR